MLEGFHTDDAKEDTESEECYRETDSDSDGYIEDAPNPPEQSRAASSLRALTSYLSFEIDEKVREKITQAVLALIKSPTEAKIMQVVEDIHLSITNSPKIIAFKRDRARHAAAIATYAIAPHIRLTRTKVSHGDLLQKFIAEMSGAKDSVKLADVRTISLFAYWSAETMAFCAVAEKLLTLSDSEYDPTRVSC